MCYWKTIILFLNLPQKVSTLDCTPLAIIPESLIDLFLKLYFNLWYQEMLKHSMKQLNLFLEVPNPNHEFLAHLLSQLYHIYVVSLKNTKLVLLSSNSFLGLQAWSISFVRPTHKGLIKSLAGLIKIRLTSWTYL